MKKFMKKKHIFKSAEKLKSNEDLLNIDVSKTSNHKPLNLIEIGKKSKNTAQWMCIVRRRKREKVSIRMPAILH